MQLLKSNYSNIISELTVKSFHLTHFFFKLSPLKGKLKKFIFYFRRHHENHDHPMGFEMQSTVRLIFRLKS